MQLISFERKCKFLTSPNDITWWHLTNIMIDPLFFINTVETHHHMKSSPLGAIL